MNPEQVLSLLEQVSEILSPGAQEIWRITLQAVTRLGYINLGWAVATLVGGLGFLKMAFYGVALNKKEPYGADGDGYAIPGFICASLLLAASVICITKAVCYLSMPEYCAMQKLLEMLRGG